ncbi:dihydrolipoamide acetyltransferase family protein [Pelagibacterium sp. H642]|uniref:dihydrolipoamide acetyltransferase family protein n=1 Tax=Pelagibacterium sp. H642 TaxID=1881069 RepID=UPI00281510AE|nr:dihydrolipoamide acetyltransferase family protein [Pelagibacterium sp. H642]WMT90831.1 2-oxo acid dehydrogenase subunit E2 [Pelagibacterium sp. H642]
MKTFEFRLPDIGEGVAEAEITAWYVKVGDIVEEDQTLVDVMTDKATIDMTSPVAGKVLKLHGAEGDKAPVGSVLVELEIEGEGDVEATATPSFPAAKHTTAIPGEDPGSSKLGAGDRSSAAPLASAERTGSRLEAGMTPGEGGAGDPMENASPILAAPATRRRAEDLSIDLADVTGTGPEGRITDADLDAYLKSRAPAPAARERHGVNEVKIIGLRRKIAERMELSARTIPHFSYVEDCDMTALEGLRREINASRQGTQPKLTLLPFFMRALAQLLPEFPFINAHFDSEAGVLHQFEPIHIGIATQTADGLMVPVVRHAEALDIWDCAREMSRVTNAAREGRASRDELSGSTITLTSLGALGGVAATPIINHPEVAIIGPNKLIGRPVFINNQVTVRTMMNLSSSFDHRIVDGYEAAKFIQRLKRLLENPALIFVEKRSWG